MPTLKSNEMGSVGGGREYDSEIKDMANYVHNYKIDSDLAVCAAEVLSAQPLTHSVRNRSLRFPRHPRLRSGSPPV